MKKQIAGSIMTLLAGAGLSVAQTSPMLPSMKSTDAPSSAPASGSEAAAAAPADKQTQQAGDLLPRKDKRPGYVTNSGSFAGVDLPDEPNAFDGSRPDGSCPDRSRPKEALRKPRIFRQSHSS